MSNTASDEFKPSELPCPNSSASYWHSEPNVFLLNHRTTASLPEICDIVIIGSGITGASVARYLAEDDRTKGLSVVMLEARQACWGATGRNVMNSIVKQLLNTVLMMLTTGRTLSTTANRTSSTYWTIRDKECRSCTVLYRKA